MQSVTQRSNSCVATNELIRMPWAISYSGQKHGQDLDVVLFRKHGMKAVLKQAGKVTLKQGRVILEASEHLVMATNKSSSWL